VQTLIYNLQCMATHLRLTGPTYRVKAQLQLAFRRRHLTADGQPVCTTIPSRYSPCIRSAGVTRDAGQSDAGGCLHHRRCVGRPQRPVQNALGCDRLIPAFSPKLQYNLRARYDWTFNEYKSFAQVGMTHVDDMSNQPSSFQSVTRPHSTTTWLRYTMPATTRSMRRSASRKERGRVDLRPKSRDKNASTFTTWARHQGRSAAASTGPWREGRL